PVTWRIIVPGWSHFYLRQKWRAQLFFWGFLALFLPAILMFGTGTGSVLLGLAFSVHTSAAFDIVNQRGGPQGLGPVFLRSIVVTILIAVLIYLPAGMLLSCGASPRVLRFNVGTLASG